jgi:hypothetical protein
MLLVVVSGLSDDAESDKRVSAKGCRRVEEDNKKGEVLRISNGATKSLMVAQDGNHFGCSDGFSFSPLLMSVIVLARDQYDVRSIFQMGNPELKSCMQYSVMNYAGFSVILPYHTGSTVDYSFILEFLELGCMLIPQMISVQLDKVDDWSAKFTSRR